MTHDVLAPDALPGEGWIGTLILRPCDRMGGTDRDPKIWSPHLMIAGRPLQHVAYALGDQAARQESPDQKSGAQQADTWKERTTWHVEDGPLLENPLAPEHSADQCSTLWCCPCGEDGCGSTQVQVTPGRLGGVDGAWLSGWATRSDPDARLPLPPVFIPRAAWPQEQGQMVPVGATWAEEDGRTGAVSPEDEVAAAQAREVWRLSRAGAHQVARQAAAALRDPWGHAPLADGRPLDEHIADALAWRLARRIRPLRRAEQLNMAQARLETLRGTEPEAYRPLSPKAWAELTERFGLAAVQARDERARTEHAAVAAQAHASALERAQQELHELALSPRDARVARRARRRQEKREATDIMALLRGVEPIIHPDLGASDLHSGLLSDLNGRDQGLDAQLERAWRSARRSDRRRRPEPNPAAHTPGSVNGTNATGSSATGSSPNSSNAESA